MERYVNQILTGDAMEILPTLPDKCVDLLLTDPPYGGGCKHHESARTVSRTGGTWAAKYGTGIKSWDIPPTAEDFRELFRVSKNQIIWGGNYFPLPPTRCFNIWKKLTISERFTMAMAEYAWCSFNSNAKLWEYAPQDPERFHPAQKPLRLICRQLEEYTAPGDLVLDPYSGSGTTAVACHLLDRRFICIERDPEYAERSRQRLSQVAAQGLLL